MKEFWTQGIMLHGSLNLLVTVVRLLMSLFCGGMIGLSRSVKRRSAGFKTHSLVCLGSCLITLTAQYIFVMGEITSDLARLPAQIISGVGFLGVGTIIVTGNNHVRGLTTAAGLWAGAGIGIAIGFGYYSGGIIATVLILCIYGFLSRVDDYAYSHSRILDLYVEFESRSAVTEFLKLMREKGYKVSDLELSKPKKGIDSTVSARFSLRVPTAGHHDEYIQELNDMDCVEYVEEFGI